uniref:Putative ovule protein n=1 Tax=Solanum chacoense TaxID=4108 RepID=A0A0V0GMJ6_SOLCH
MPCLQSSFNSRLVPHHSSLFLSFYKEFKSSAKVMFDKSFVFSSEAIVASDFSGKVTRVFLHNPCIRKFGTKFIGQTNKFISVLFNCLRFPSFFAFSNFLTRFKTFMPQILSSP